MPDYDFRLLSSYDFELLARDLLQEEMNVRLESFSRGRDGGIDFRFRSTNGALVVQCKHYANYDDLSRVLNRDEVKKVQRLKPNRYLLVVSTPLTPPRKEKLLQLFAPFCRGTQDIFGREDLNNLLARHPSVERQNFKLWLTSEPVLTRFLHAGIWGDAELTLQRIRRRASRYVPNPSFNRAKGILDEHHYCIIAGIPGIGKTTLAEILLIDYVDRHSFQAIRIANDLSEIKGVKNPRNRQIFYFDDFLGTKALDKLQKNEDQRLVEFLEEVAANPNWRFVLTTREYILNAAKIRYEAFAYPPVSLKPCVVELSDYMRPIRGRILYNHIFFSDLPNPYKCALLENKHYEQILSHQNYNPRLIEHLTQARNLEHVSAHSYFEDFIANLANPKRIWEHAFRHQLAEAAQHVLIVMGSLPDEVLVKDLELAFNAFFQYRRARHGFSVSSRDFERALKELDGNFIKTTLIGRDQIAAFHNPSVGDFLEGYLASSPQDVEDLIESAVFFDQLQQLWRGQRGIRFGGIDAHAAKFISKVAKIFSTPVCRVIRVGDGSGQIVGVQSWDESFEARTLFAVEVASALGRPEAHSVVDCLLGHLQNRILEDHGDKDDLVRLLKVLESKPSRTTIRPIFDAAIGYLTRNLEVTEDFSSLGKFIESFPDAIVGAELDGIRAAFGKFRDSYDDSWVDKPDDLRGVADDFERIGTQLKVDVAAFCEGLNQAANEMERELRHRESEPEEADYEWRADYQSADSIESMFDGLLQEIHESIGSDS